MNVGAAGGPPRREMAVPAGVVHVSALPQCHRTWTPIMNRTARPLARSNPRTRSRLTRPVMESSTVGRLAGTALGAPGCAAIAGLYGCGLGQLPRVLIGCGRPALQD